MPTVFKYLSKNQRFDLLVEIMGKKRKELTLLESYFSLDLHGGSTHITVFSTAMLLLVYMLPPSVKLYVC